METISSNIQQGSLLVLPDEILAIIIGKSTTISIAKLKQSCKRLKSIIERFKLEKVKAENIRLIYNGFNGPMFAMIQFPEGIICRQWEIPYLQLPVNTTLHDVMSKIEHTKSVTLVGDLDLHCFEIMREFRHKVREFRIGRGTIRLGYANFLHFLNTFDRVEIANSSFANFAPTNQMIINMMIDYNVVLTGMSLRAVVTDDILPLLKQSLPERFHIPACTTSITLAALKPFLLDVLRVITPIDWDLGNVQITNAAREEPAEDEDDDQFIFDIRDEDDDQFMPDIRNERALDQFMPDISNERDLDQFMSDIRNESDLEITQDEDYYEISNSSTPTIQRVVKFQRALFNYVPPVALPLQRLFHMLR